MPKQLYKITQFHGGLNSNSDARDIAENELSEATDVMVDELGKIRLMGGNTAQGAAARTNQISPGYGLFQFSHDRIDGHTVAANANDPETGADYLAFSEPDTAGTVDIYSNQDTTWGSPITDMANNTAGLRKDIFYAADGALRVCDAEFGNTNDAKWYGYIDRKQFGDGTTGLDEGSTDFENGDVFDGWHAADQKLTPIQVNSLSGAHGASPDDTTSDPDINDPIWVDLDAGASGVSNPRYNSGLGAGDAGYTSLHTLTAFYVNFDASADSMKTMDSSNAAQHIGIEDFITAGDHLRISSAANSDNDDRIVVVDEVDVTTGAFDEIKITGSFTADTTSDYIFVANLTRMAANTGWYDPILNHIQIAVSTLYDDSKQESELASVRPIIDINKTMDYLGNLDLDTMVVTTGIFTEDTNEFGKTYPRVSGFKVYARKATSTNGSGNWYLLQEIDIEKGGRLADVAGVGGDYVMWRANFYYSGHAGDCASTENGPSNYEFNPFPSIRTYASETGSSPDEMVIVDAYKTAVVANRMAYIGHIKQNDVVYGDKVLKSNINKFDRFPESRIIEASINDGDSIVKLEVYADRLLIFKKTKLELVNISQEVEFLEDTFKHKGVVHHTATCKTDFGIAWVNREGCYLYDGQKVNNLLEKQGRQIIKESDWASFTTDNSIIGYVPKKRQLIVLKDCTATSTGDIYLYDIVTTSWVKGDSKFVDSQIQTNFVTDWNGDLVHIYDTDTGYVHKWDDASDASAAVDIKTKDIDFGNPGQDKRIYKFYVTHRGSASNIQLSYGINGEQDSSDFTSTGSELPVTSAVTDWVTTAITPTAFSCKSVRLRLFSQTTTTPANFEINDITIVFRLKGQR